MRRAGSENIFIWGLHSNIAQEVNMKNPRTLNRAMELAKRADVAITISRRSGQRDARSQEQKKPAAVQQPEQQSEDEGTGKTRKANKNWKSGNAGASGGQPQRTGGYLQGHRPGNPQFRGGRSHPAPAQNTGLGPRTFGPGNQRKTRFAAVQPQEQDSEVMVDQQGQESAQQADRSDPTASPESEFGKLAGPPLWPAQYAVGGIRDRIARGPVL